MALSVARNPPLRDAQVVRPLKQRFIKLILLQESACRIQAEYLYEIVRVYDFRQNSIHAGGVRQFSDIHPGKHHRAENRGKGLLPFGHEIDSERLPRTEPVVADNVGNMPGTQDDFRFRRIGGSFDTANLAVEQSRQRTANRPLIIYNQ